MDQSLGGAAAVNAPASPPPPPVAIARGEGGGPTQSGVPMTAVEGIDDRELFLYVSKEHLRDRAPELVTVRCTAAILAIAALLQVIVCSMGIFGPRSRRYWPLGVGEMAMVCTFLVGTAVVFWLASRSLENVRLESLNRVTLATGVGYVVGGVVTLICGITLGAMDAYDLKTLRAEVLAQIAKDEKIPGYIPPTESVSDLALDRKRDLINQLWIDNLLRAFILLFLATLIFQARVRLQRYGAKLKRWTVMQDADPTRFDRLRHDLLENERQRAQILHGGSHYFVPLHATRAETQPLFAAPPARDAGHAPFAGQGQRLESSWE